MALRTPPQGGRESPATALPGVTKLRKTVALPSLYVALRSRKLLINNAKLYSTVEHLFPDIRKAYLFSTRSR
jgi:hypothetical protein